MSEKLYFLYLKEGHLKKIMGFLPDKSLIRKAKAKHITAIISI
jgi:hypothetical protein